MDSSQRKLPIRLQAASAPMDGGAPASGRRLTGPLRWVWAVGRSPLDRTAKLVLYALTAFIDYQTWQCNPSVPRLAEMTTMTDAAVRRALDRARKSNVICDVVRSSGGVNERGRGNTNLIRANPEVLEALGQSNPRRRTGLNRIPRTGLNPIRRDLEPTTARDQTLDGVAPNPIRRIGEHTNEQTFGQINAHTTTSTSEQGGGGGAGAGAVRDPELRKAEQSENADFEASNALLIGYGVIATNARNLSLQFSPRVVEAGIEWVKKYAGNMDSKPAALVIALRDGSAQQHAKLLTAQAAAREKVAAEHEAVVHHAWRVERVAVLIADTSRALRNANDRENFPIALKNIRQVWPTDDAIARSAVLSDELLNDAMTKPRKAFFALARAAKDALSARQSDQTASPGQVLDRAQPKTDGLASGEHAASGVEPPPSAASTGEA